ncbi:dnaJ subfamily C member 5 [Trichonephila clavipes]|nr:dnaJ subfamily C member 5 [Trichonephila clavipes]
METRNSPQLSNGLILVDAIARCKLSSHPVKKHFIPDLSSNCIISTTIARLQTRHFKEMKISPDDQESYITCPNCSDFQLSPNPIFNCPSTLAKFLNIDLNSTNHQLLYSPKIVDIARAEEYESGGSAPSSPIRTQPQSSEPMAMPPPGENVTEMTGLKSAQTVTYMTGHGASTNQ